LRAHGARGGFCDEVKAALAADPSLVAEIAARLLEGQFPESHHADILAAVGLEPPAPKALKRDRAFRQRVLVGNEYRCAVCGLGVRLGSVSVALDAAHIRWHQAGGPDGGRVVAGEEVFTNTSTGTRPDGCWVASASARSCWR
jgi:putative restriction endonuclease